MKGYMGKVLDVDLSTGSVGHSNLEQDMLRQFIGGGGLAAKLFLDRVPPDVEPLSGENVLFIMTGPLAGTNLPGSSRFCVCAKSPLTGIWGEANCGGNLAPQLKSAGYDGIAIKGASDKPVYLSIEDDRVELRDASGLWGRDVYETTDLLRKQFGKGGKVSVLTIGPAGENLVRYACIIGEKHDAAGRCGLGAAMGAKKLKAIVVRGTGKVEPARPAEFTRVRKQVRDKVNEHVVTHALRGFGTDIGMVVDAARGDVPGKNWSWGDNLPVASKIGGEAMAEKYIVKSYACHACPVACKNVVQVKDPPYEVAEGPGPEYQTCASFGTLLMNDNLAGIIKANEACNRHGMDTISCGATIAFAIDCFENGLIDRKDTDGIELRWGDIDAVLQMMEKIARRDGFGDILAEGSRGAAQRLGRNAAAYTVEVKGLELPMHDPRGGGHAQGLAYAVSPIGASHNQHLAHDIETNMITFPEIGLPGGYEAASSEGKAALNVTCENAGMVRNSAIICYFVLYALGMDDVADMLKATTGFDYSMEELMECGERIWFLKRGLSNLMGAGAVEDRLPQRIMTPLKEGPVTGTVPDMALMLKEYYELRSLDDGGRPSKDKLHSLGLAELAARL